MPPNAPGRSFSIIPAHIQAPGGNTANEAKSARAPRALRAQRGNIYIPTILVCAPYSAGSDPAQKLRGTCSNKYAGDLHWSFADNYTALRHPQRSTNLLKNSSTIFFIFHLKISFSAFGAHLCENFESTGICHLAGHLTIPDRKAPRGWRPELTNHARAGGREHQWRGESHTQPQRQGRNPGAGRSRGDRNTITKKIYTARTH
jgi:hypothetical protein